MVILAAFIALCALIIGLCGLFADAMNGASEPPPSVAPYVVGGLAVALIIIENEWRTAMHDLILVAGLSFLVGFKVAAWLGKRHLDRMRTIWRGEHNETVLASH